jgi:lipoprotein-anchoring transpeptidase ErfK/SrfK
MKLKSLFISMGLSISLAYSSTTITDIKDICQSNLEQECPNNTQDIKLLQTLLNRSGVVKNSLKVDGKLGTNTQNAIIEFQKKYRVYPTKGYVGSKTKLALQRFVAGKKIAKSNRYTKPLKPKCYNCYADFKKNVNLKKSYAVYTDKKLLAKARRARKKLLVDVSQQRVRLIVDGKVALDSPCTTGARHKFEPNTRIYRDKHTPLGTYRIKEKIANKRSTIFGDIYRNGRRIYHGDRRKYRGSWRGVKFVGASLKHWMRLTSSGIGLHASKYVKRYAGTNGCIRLPYNVAHTLFSKVDKGTVVKVVR